MPTVKVPCLLDIPSDEEIYVNYSTRDGTAIAGRDYIATTGAVLFPAGTRFREVDIDIVFGAHEGHFFVDLEPPTNGRLWKTEAKITLRHPSQSEVTIQSMFDDLWHFIVRSTGTNADDAGIPQLTTVEGLVKNNQFVGGALGGYTPDGTASSEGIAILLRSVAQAYEVDGDPAKLEYCNFLMQAAIEYFFRGEFPSEVPGEAWNHHWIVNAGPPFAVRGPLREADVEPEPEVGPIITISPIALNFGFVEVNEESEDKYVSIGNTGTSALVISSHTITGPFELVGNFPTTIQPGTAERVYIKFLPVEEGSASGTIKIVTNTPSSPQTVSLAGTGQKTQRLTYLTADGALLRDEDGEEVMLRSINWYGFEQIFIPGGAWTRPFRTKSVNGVVREGMLDEIKRLGFNSIRLLVSEDCSWPGAKPQTGFGFWNTTFISTSLNPEFLNSTEAQNPQDVKTTLEIMDIFIGWCEDLGLRVVFDLHCLAPDNDNILGTNGKWYTTSTPNGVGATSGARREPRNEQQAIDALVFLADRYKNRPVVCGFDLINEPHGCTWDRDPMTGVVGYYERCGKAIHEVNPNVLIICEGVSENGMNSGTVDHTPVGHESDPESQQGKYKWGTIWSGKLDEVARIANVHVTLDVPNKVVYSPHEYGAYFGGANLAHQWFHPEDVVGPGYAGLPFPQNMPSVWSRQWGYLAEQNIAPVWIGEFGSYFRIGGDPVGGGGSAYSQLHLDADTEWMRELADYCNAYKIGFAYWAWNPAGDPDGLVGQQPAGTWHSAQQFKLDHLQPFLPDASASALVVAPTSLDFGEVSVGSSSTRDVVVSNLGAENVPVTFTIPSGFTGDRSSANIPPSGSVILKVRYAPTEEETRSGNLLVSSASTQITVAIVASGKSGSTIPDVDFPPNAYGITAVGDSLTWFGWYENNGWVDKMCFYSGQKWVRRGVKAVIASTSMDALSKQLPEVLAMNPPPRICVVATGTNNVYSTAGVNDVKAICTQLLANNILPVLWTVPPRNDQPQLWPNIAAWNSLIRDYAVQTGLPIADAHTAMLKEGSDSELDPAYDFGDGLHFNLRGMANLGRKILESFETNQVPSDQGLVVLPTAVGGGNAFLNPLAVDSNGDGVMDRLTVQAGFTGQISAGQDGVAGNWQRITRAIATTGSKSNSFEPIVVQSGGKYRIAIRLKWNTNGVEFDDNTNWFAGVNLYITDTNWKSFGEDGVKLVIGRGNIPEEEGVALLDFTVPVGANRAVMSVFNISNNTVSNNVPISFSIAQIMIKPIA